MKTPILILPGWKLPGTLYADLVLLFKKRGYRAFALDLPGFSQDKLKVDLLTLDDYVEFVEKFMKSYKISSAILIGHSFGGRLAIKYAYLYPKRVEKLILTGVPIIRNITLKKRAASILAFVGKKMIWVFPHFAREFLRKLLYYSIGEWDYYKSGNLKKVFVNVINEDLAIYLKKIYCPIFLLWGEKDTFIPASDIEKIKKLNPNIESKIIPGCGHRLPIENPKIFLKEYLSFP